MLNSKQKAIQDARNIDFSKWMSEDTLGYLQDKIKGLIVLQYALSDVEETGYKNMSYVYGVIADSLQSLEDEIEALKPKLNYMDSFARVGTDELVTKEALS